jgi:hypothetical protein
MLSVKEIQMEHCKSLKVSKFICKNRIEKDLSEIRKGQSYGASTTITNVFELKEDEDGYKLQVHIIAKEGNLKNHLYKVSSINFIN